ncbi:MAG: carbamate kinase [Alphaproteobacteria bacterium]|jgi:carbamate kinase|nr:carbamate kinase [Alphaproteobacteria bacterium]
MAKLVIALGGNALEDTSSPTAENQLKVIQSNVPHLVDLISEGHELIITHGNGPQVGRILLQNEAGKDLTPVLPFDVCGAMSQGMIGYQIQQSLHEELLSRGINKDVVSLITQVVVDAKDEAFKNPTKPIGPFYSKAEAELLAKEKGYSIKEDAGRGYRRVVASPLPIDIVELNSIKKLSDSGVVVIASGGGGIPVVKDGKNSLKGVAAVIDKDFASAKLAENLNADTLIILTAVDKVFINYGKENQQALDNVSLADLDKYAKENQFAAGSMLPKIRACENFVKSKIGRKALITSLSKVKEALNRKNGTWIA